MNNSWKNTAIAPDSSIRDALLLLDKSALRIALVVDNTDTLLGVLTDGDIRRGLLRNCTLQHPVSDVMNPSPQTAAWGTPRRELVKLMTERKLLSIPLLKDDKVVGLEILQTSEASVQYDNPVFLMAGGFGSRLKPLTDNCPKPLLNVGDKPILEIIIENFVRAGFHRFFISTHFLPQMLREHFGDGQRWGVSIRYTHEHEPLGTAGALGLVILVIAAQAVRRRAEPTQPLRLPLAILALVILSFNDSAMVTTWTPSARHSPRRLSQ